MNWGVFRDINGFTCQINFYFQVREIHRNIMNTGDVRVHLHIVVKTLVSNKFYKPIGCLKIGDKKRTIMRH